MKELDYTPPFPPSLWAEFILLFDNDFPIEQVNELLEIEPTISSRQAETRINPVTKKNNPGFWLYQTEAISSFDFEPLLLEIEHFLEVHSLRLEKVIQQCLPSSLILRIKILVRQEDEYPAIYFYPKILQLFSSLNISLEIVIE